MQKTCKLSGWPFEVSEMEMNLIKKMDLGEPQFHPTIRSAMRLAFRNERNLFIRKCDFSGERILSVYSEDKPFPVKASAPAFAFNNPQPNFASGPAFPASSAV